MSAISNDRPETFKPFIRVLFKLALPIAVQNFLNASMALIDTLMIGQLNETAIAAVGIANQFVFIFIVVQYGIHSGVSVFTAQYWGRKEYEKLKKLIGISLLGGSFISLFFTMAAVVFPEYLMGLFSRDGEVVRLGAGYLRTVGISFVVTAIAYAYMSNLRSIGVVRIPMYACTIAVFMNIFLNWIFIFGNLGCPPLGVGGAALATCISKSLEGLLLVSLVFYNKYPIAAGFKEMLDVDFLFVKQILTTCWPVFFNELMWVIGISFYNLVYARIGTDAIAAVNIVSSIENFVLIPFFGLFHAGAIMVGNSIGAGRRDAAYNYGKYLLRMQFLMAILAGGLMILSRDLVLGFYKVSDAAYMNAYHLMAVAGIALCVKITNFTNVVCVLRGGGDTRFAFWVDLSGVWFIGVPMSFLGAFYFHLPVYWVMAMVVSEEIYKLGIGIRRFRSRKWIRDLVAEN